jgi:spermidine/putrescine transport system substrate-binding protein
VKGLERWFARLAGVLLVLVVIACGSRARGPLVVLEWSGYEQPEFWRAFAAKHPDVKVDYTFFAEDSEAYAKLQSGFTADVVHPHIGWLELYVANDMLQPIDTTKLSNWSKVMPELARLGQVDGVQYLVPWEWGYDSILVRTDKVKEVPDAWADIWDPQYKGRVSIYDSAEAAVVMASLALGYDPYTLTEAQLDEVKAKLIALKPNLLGYWTDYTEINQQVASGEVWVAVNTWPDAYVAVKAEGVPVEYINPVEGRIGWVYGFAIPKSAKHPDLAHDYIDATLADDAMLYMATSYGYGASNADIVKDMDPEIVRVMQLDTPEVLRQARFFQSLTEEQRRTWTTLWGEVKASQ